MTTSRPLLASNLHEIGTRLVDLLNQTGFLYRFPDVAGVTLACIAQHIEPTERLLADCKDVRLRLGRSQSDDGYGIGDINCEDPLRAAFEYALSGYRVFAGCMKAITEQDGDVSPDNRRALLEALPIDRPGDPHRILELKDLIESHSPAALDQAGSAFEPLAEADWQGFRMVLFFFLVELEKCRR